MLRLGSLGLIVGFLGVGFLGGVWRGFGLWVRSKCIGSGINCIGFGIGVTS